MRTIRAAGAVLAVAAVALGLTSWTIGWSALWANPDQRGRYLFERERYAEAAAAFADPMWRGVAQFHAGDFKSAEATFAAADTADAAFDQGNALVFLGKYEEAVARYDHALDLRPDWDAARANRKIAALRAERMKAPGEDAGDQREGADQVVYDKDASNPQGQETQVSGAPMNDEAVRALWLKRVQTKPADFLKARFAYQLQSSANAGEQPAETPP